MRTRKLQQISCVGKVCVKEGNIKGPKQQQQPVKGVGTRRRTIIFIYFLFLSSEMISLVLYYQFQRNGNKSLRYMMMFVSKHRKRKPEGHFLNVYSIIPLRRRKKGDKDAMGMKSFLR